METTQNEAQKAQDARILNELNDILKLNETLNAREDALNETLNRLKDILRKINSIPDTPTDEVLPNKINFLAGLDVFCLELVNLLYGLQSASVNYSRDPTSGKIEINIVIIPSEKTLSVTTTKINALNCCKKEAPYHNIS